MPGYEGKGSLVWFDGNVGYLLPGKLLSFVGQDVKVQHEADGQVHIVRANAVLPRQELDVHGVDNMIKMDDLHVGSILYNIRKRYRQDQIYTYIGSILVAVNPYMPYDIYGPDAVQKYFATSTKSHPPHLFAIGNAAYQTMLRTENKQAIIISGETGAGKTESSRLLVEFLAAVNQTDGRLVTKQIVEATPLLESFGNAKTMKNDNSSRFGKYLEIFYDSHGKIAGGRISEYLLERSRIVGQANGERNYHIFYEMLCGLPEEQKEKLNLTTATDFMYLNQGKACVIPNRKEVFYFQQVVEAMDVLGISENEKEAIFKVLALILHLGNVDFGRTEASGQEAAVIMGQTEVMLVSQLLGLEIQDLVVCLTHKETVAGGQKVKSPRSINQAVDARDALAKELYTHLFGWLISKVNDIMYSGKKQTSIAVLDIFGFEDFEKNSFEQLCINFANETLQFFFNQFVFRMEQDEYSSEHIRWTKIPFFDNQPRLDLLAKPPHGLIHILAETTAFPKADDLSFLDKCHHHHEQNKFYEKPKMSTPEFAICHYAGTVWYQATGFLEKNRDGLKPDLEDLISSCGNEFIQDLFPELQSAELSIKGLKLPSQRKNSLRLPLTQKKKPTVCGKFNDSLIKLVVAMKSCNPFFVRCIKPNSTKAAGKFEIPLVIEQLRYCGIVETVKIRKAGYPVRHLYADFIKRYSCLSSHVDLTSTNPRENTSRILKLVEFEPESYQFGKTKVFLKEDLHATLEDARMAKLNRMAVVIQARMRGYYVNSKYLKMKKAAIVIQSNTRRHLERKKFLKARKGFILLQAVYRMKQQRRAFLKIYNESHQRAAKKQVLAASPAPSAEEPAELKNTPEVAEIEKQIVTDVTHLEIPADLALVFANIQGWSLANGSSVHETRGDVIKHDYATSKLPDDINDFPFSKFVQEHFQSEHQWRMLRAPLRTSLLPVKYSDSVMAIGLFQLVMRFMDDESITDAKEFAVGNYLVQMGIFKPELREEMYCHLCNQTWGNLSDTSNKRGWLLLALFLCCFAPSSRLYKHLLKYVSDQAFNGYKSYCQHKMLCWDTNGSPVARSHPPTHLEWQAAKMRTNMAAECHFPDGERRTAEVESCTTGEELASLILKDRGIDDPKGWSVDLESSDWHCSLAGKDYVLDLISELEYPPAFPLSRSSSLLTVKPGHTVPESQLKTLSNLHMPQARGKSVAEIAHKFSFVDHQPPSSPSHTQREDALSAATSARLASVSSHGQVEDRLVQRSRLGSSSGHVELATPPSPFPQVFVPPPPPPPPAFVPPPPPPPPPVVPPTERVILRRKPTKKDKDRKKRDSGGPQLSMAEVVAKAKRMREQRERVLSAGSGSATSDTKDPSDDPFESAMQARVVQLKSRRVEVQQAPRQEEDSELMKEMRRKANRASRAFVENEKATHLSVEDNVFVVQVESERRPSRDNSSCSSREAGDNDSLQSLESSDKLESPKQVKDFVDSLFDPVLSQGVEGLSDELALQGALKGGGGVNQPNTAAASASTATVSTAPAVNGHPAGQPHTQGNGYPVHPAAQAPGNGYPGMMQANGFPGMMPGAAMFYGMPQANGPLAGLPQAGLGGMGASLYQPNMNAAMLAAQQQVIIERLIAQQALLQQQATVASQKQQEQLLMLAQQQQAQLEQMQHILAAASQPGAQQVENQAAEASLAASTSTATNGHIVSHNGGTTIEVLSPPTEFLDGGHSPPPHSPIPPPPSPLVLIPPRSTSLPPSTVTISTHHEQASSVTEAFPPPPPPISEDNNAAESVNTPQRPGLPRRSTDKIALAVAALEAKSEEPRSPGPASPLKHGDSFSFSVSSPARKESAAKDRPDFHKRTSSSLGFVVLSDKQNNTVLHPRSTGPYLSYSHAKWRLNIRKEVFTADEKVNNNLMQRLIFLQILRDSYSNCCCKMSKDDCKRMQLLLQKYGITPERPHSSIPVEDIIIEAARQLPLYFSRFFVVKGQNELPDVHYLAVSEHGIKLVKREKITDELEIVRSIPYTELVKLKAVKDKLTLTLTKEVKVVVNTERAIEAKQLIDTYLRHLEKEVKYVRALYDHVSPEPTLLNFKKGDVIKIVPKDGLEEGWVYGVFNNHGGYFPADFVTHIQEDPQAVPSVRPSNLVKAASVGSLLSLDADGPMSGESRGRAGSVKSTKSDNSQYNSDKHSMMEFAMHYFRFGREALVRGEDGTIRGTVKVRGTLGRSSKASHKKDKAEWTWSGLAELVKYSRVPLQASLVRLDSTQLNKLAVDAFQMIMRFMGDLPMSKHQKETEIVFSLLKMCREIPDLRDEVYCQLIKQVTSNKSQKAESASRGWRLLIIITAYIECSDVFKPYLITFLQSTASDPKREFHGAAATCEMNLMKTFKYGGRKTPPSKEELNQLVQGRQTKRQVFVLPGGTRMLKVQTSSTGYDVIKEMCGDMDLMSENHYKEYGLFTFMEGQNVMVPVQTTDYIMDVVSSMERQQFAFSLCFRRVLWLQGLRLDNELLVSVIYHQVLPDFMAGFLLATHGRSFGDAQFQNQIAELGALQYRARDRSTTPANNSEVESLIPRGMQEKLRPQQWLMLIQDHFRSCHTLTPHQARRRFLETVTKWPYFGSTFFEVKKCSHPAVSGDCILAVNRTGVHFLSHTTVQTLLSEPFMSIISTRLLISDKKRQFLDLKIGSAMMQKVTRMETSQAKEISNLIYKYVAMHSSAKQEGQGLAGVMRSQQESQRM
ncbi:unconventional myosin-XV-like isoform X3 [Oculina patagonica]